MNKVTTVSLLALAAAGFVVLTAIPAKAGDVSTDNSKGPVSGPQSYTGLAMLAKSAGFQGNDIALAAAIAMAESGGDPMAYNPETAAGAPQGKGSFGLWQIYLHAHPEFENINLYDPQQNAHAAFAIYTNAGNSFKPWSTFNNQAYVQFVPDGILV